jgi:DnaJ family protein C protein 7
LESKKAAGNEAYEKGDYQGACDIYTAALSLDELNDQFNRTLYANRAAALMKLGRLKDAIRDCTVAIELDANYTKAYIRRAKIYVMLEHYEEAVRDYERASKMNPTDREIRASLQHAQNLMKRVTEKTHYEVLEVEKDATLSDIKKAYKQQALKWHPDKNSESQELKLFAESKFKLISEAFTILSDSAQRRQYDLDLLTQKGSYRPDPYSDSDFYARRRSYYNSWGASTTSSSKNNNNNQTQARGNKNTKGGQRTSYSKWWEN